MSSAFSSLQELLDEIQTSAFDPATADRAVALGEAIVALLGSGPALAEIESVAATNEANGVMYANAQKNQQLGNIIGMVVTMQCVQALLNSNSNTTPPHGH